MLHYLRRCVYYYTSDAQTSHSYHLENLRVGYRRAAWTISLWARNLFNVQYAQQGFFFWANTAELPEPVLSAAGRSASGRDNCQL